MTSNICLTMDVLESGVLCYVAGHAPVGSLYCNPFLSELQHCGT